MKKYRLIREYPGSPKLGTIITPTNGYGMTYLDAHKYPEFWEEIVEKDYEILSFKSKCEQYRILDTNTGLYKYFEPGSHQLLSKEYLIQEGSYQIHSVKRLSDNEVFTIGDKVNSTISDLGRFTDLTGFKLDNNKISLGLKIGSRGVGYYPLNTIIKCEKPIEKDYEILSVISNTFPTNIFYRNKQNFNEYLKDDNPHIIYTLDYIIENLNKHIKIHSVKRKSDGEVFTIGDRIKDTLSNCITNISEITLKNIRCFLNGVNINNVEKLKQPLFTTEDGIDIYDPLQKVFSVSECDFKLQNHQDYGWIITRDPKRKYYHFSTKEAAEEYILMNKPCLSVKDILKRFNSRWSEITETTLKELVKSKILKL